MNFIVYCITNTRNGKKYVGQTTTSLKARLKAHKQRAGKAPWPIAHAFHKYGEALKAEVIQECHSQDELDAAEMSWIAKLNTICPRGYNLRPGGLGGATHERTKALLRARVFTPEWRKKLSDAGKNRAVSTETRQKIAFANRGRKYSAEQRMRKRGVGNPNVRINQEIADQIRTEYKKGRLSQEKIAPMFGISQSTVSLIVLGHLW